MSEEDTFVEEEQEEEHAYRVPTKQEGNKIKKNHRKDIRTEHTTEQSTAQGDSKVLTEMRDLVQTLVSQLMSQANDEIGKKPQLGGTGFGRRENVQCYARKLRGHFARDCPNKTGNQAGSRSTGPGMAISQKQGNNRHLN